MYVNKRIIEKFRQYITILFFIIFSMKAFGQKLRPYQVSKDVSIEIPQEFSVTDTLGQMVIKSSIEDEIILIMKPEKKIDAYIENKDELLKFYEGFQKGMIDQSSGDLIDKKFVQINGFYFLKSSFRTKITGDDKIWNNYVLLLNKTSYTFIMISSPKNLEKVIIFEEKIIPSIKLKKGLTQENQLNTNNEDSTAYRIGQLIGKLLVYAIIGSIIIFFIYVVRKRKKSV